MKKQKFNIRVYAENDTTKLKEVTGELITEKTLSMKAFIVKNQYDYSVNEFYTGLLLTSGSTKQKAIEDFLKRERNIEFWKNADDRIAYNQKTIEDCIKSYGYANRD